MPKRSKTNNTPSRKLSKIKSEGWEPVDNANLFTKSKKLYYKKLPDDVYVARNLHNSKYLDYIFTNPNEIKDYLSFLNSVRHKIIRVLEEDVRTKGPQKSNMFYVNVFNSPNTTNHEFAFHTSNETIVSVDDVVEHVDSQISNLMERIAERQLSGSGFTLDSIKHLEVRVSKLDMLRVGSFIHLPDWIKAKNCVVNVQSKDNKCFVHCLLAKYKSNSPNIVTEKNIKENAHRYNFDKMNFPATKSDVKLFLSQNPRVSINIYGVAKKQIYPVMLSKGGRKEEHFDLLLLETKTKSHYAWIVNMSRLLAKQVTRRNGELFYCERCLLHFCTQKKKDIHVSACGNEKLAAVKLPSKKEYFKFDNYKAAQLAPLIMTLDMEACLEPISGCTPSPEKSYTNPLQRHVPISIGVHSCCNLPHEDIPTELPLGYHAFINESERELEKEFIAYLDRFTAAAKQIFDRNCPIDMSPKDEQNFQEATICYVCNQKFKDDKQKARDHSHLQSKSNYRGAACNTPCNLNLRKINFIPIYVHGLGNYDAHHLIKMFARKNFTITFVPCTLEKYLSMTVYMNGIRVVFLDSYKLLNASLAQVTESLPEEKFIETKKFFAPEMFELLRRKGPFPYSFMTDPSKLNHPSLPERKYFDNDLTGEKISDEEMDRAKNIWKTYKCKTFRDFLYAYQCADTLQTMDCVQSIRMLMWSTFKLDCAFFLSIPHLSMSCMLKYTNVKLELISEGMEEIYDLVLRSVYGGMTLCNLRYTKASDTEEIIWVDCTSLYPYTMLQKMPVGGYKLVPTTLHNWTKVNPNSSFGYFLECDISFPPQCNEYLTCLPPICERKVPPGTKTTRLINDLTPKKNIVITLAQYQLVLRLGGRCDNISRVVQFRQNNFLKSYIEVISKWRREAKSTCESDQLKLILNSLYGKFSEVLMRRRDIRLVQEESQLKRLIRKGNFIDRHIIHVDEELTLTLVEMGKQVIKQNRPNIIGAQILSLSKVYMMEFWYDTLKPNFEEIELCLSDTDSYIFRVKTKNITEDLERIKDWFDFSNYSPSHKLYSTANKKVFGKFKDESASVRIREFCSPRTKCYSIHYDETEVNKLKGIQKSFVKRNLHFDDYKKCVLEKTTKHAVFKNIISKSHDLLTVEVNKLALEASDLKRVILEDGIHTLPYGHYKLDNIENDI